MTGIGFRLVRCFYRDSDAASVDRFQHRGVLIFLSHAVVTAPAVFCNQASGSPVSFRRLPQRFGHGTRGVPLAISSGVWHRPAPDSDAQAHVSRALERLTDANGGVVAANSGFLYSVLRENTDGRKILRSE